MTHDEGTEECTKEDIDTAIEEGAEPTAHTEWVPVPRDGISVRDVANMFNVDPQTYAKFIQEYTFNSPAAPGRPARCINPDATTRFNIGTDVPVPQGNQDFRAARALAEEGDSPSLAEALDRANPERENWQAALKEHYDGLVDAGTFEFRDASELSDNKARHVAK